MTRRARTEVQGRVETGLGQGGRFVALGWVRAGVRRLVGFTPYPGTLNVRLDPGEPRRRWRAVRRRRAPELTPPRAGGCGARLIPLLVAGRVPAVAVVPDVTRHGHQVVEVIAPGHLRRRLGLRDGDRVRLVVPSA